MTLKRRKFRRERSAKLVGWVKRFSATQHSTTKYSSIVPGALGRAALDPTYSLYVHGKGALQGYEKTHEVFLRGAKLDDVPSIRELSKLYAYGHRVVIAAWKALDWSKQADITLHACKRDAVTK